MKFDFDNPSQTKFYELDDGEFGTEPVFVENPEGNGEVEDDGWVVVQTLNGRKMKATIVILNATTMEVEFKGLAPEMGLYGLHARFFKFDEGCSIDDCRPNAGAASEKIAMCSGIVWIITVLTILLGNDSLNQIYTY